MVRTYDFRLDRIFKEHNIFFLLGKRTDSLTLQHIQPGNRIRVPGRIV